MAYGGVDIDGLDGIATSHMDNIAALRNSGEIAKVLAIARPTAAIEVRAIRRARDLGEDQLISTEAEVVSWVARVEREFGRRRLDLFEDKIAIEAYPLSAYRDIGAGGFQ